MGVSKTDLFSEKQNDIALIMKAMGHPARIAIIEHLLKVNSCICGDLVIELPLSQPTISQHLKELKTANLIQGTIDGNSICYCLNPKVIEKLHKYFSGISEKINSSQTSCC
jgi:DNA-binding transcriptional ArsR family regulator